MARPAKTPVDSYTAALRILGYRFHSEVELRRKLQRKGYEADDVESTLDRLRREKWLDDTRFAAALVRSRANRAIGTRRIERELESAGVERGLIGMAIDENIDAEAQRNVVERLCARRFEILARRRGQEWASGREGRDHLAAFLVRRGYPTTLALDVIREIVKRSRSQQ